VALDERLDLRLPLFGPQETGLCQLGEQLLRAGDAAQELVKAAISRSAFAALTGQDESAARFEDARAGAQSRGVHPRLLSRLAEAPCDDGQVELLLRPEEAEDVRLLLSYPEDSAGGMMTTDIATIRPGLTAAKAIEVLRNSADEAESMFYVYVTDDQNHLLGVFSLSDLILSKPDTPVTEFMHKKVVAANVLEKQDTLAQLVAKYNLLTLPVVDDDNHLLGMVTADDALDKIIPTAWKKRLPRFYYYDHN